MRTLPEKPAASSRSVAPSAVSTEASSTAVRVTVAVYAVAEVAMPSLTLKAKDSVPLTLSAGTNLSRPASIASAAIIWLALMLAQPVPSPLVSNWIVPLEASGSVVITTPFRVSAVSTSLNLKSLPLKTIAMSSSVTNEIAWAVGPSLTAVTAMLSVLDVFVFV